MTVVKFDYDALDRLFTCLNSYFAHFKHANTYRLKTALLEQNAWLQYFFRFSEGGIHRKYAASRKFRRFKHQYRHLQREFGDSVIFLQVGCFYEFFGIQMRKASRILGLKIVAGKFGYKRMCGFGEKKLDFHLERALQKGIKAIVVNQTEYYSGNLRERLAYRQYIPEKRPRL